MFVICVDNGLYSIVNVIMSGKNGLTRRTPNYQTVSIDELSKKRRGKHHDFVTGVMSDLEMLKEGSAIKIPLKEVKGESVVNLRAAINRASASKGVKISTSSDEDFFYIWRQQD